MHTNWHVEFTTWARWTHAGEKGSLFFSCGWLPQAPVRFYGLDLHVVAVEFQYVVKKRPDLLNPAWTPRRKDRLDLRRLEELLLRKGVEPSGLLSQITAA